jgi:AraC-like DNA-binding protein
LEAGAAAEVVRRLRGLPRVGRAPDGVEGRFAAIFAAVAARDRVAAGVLIAGLLLDTCRAAAGAVTSAGRGELGGVEAFIAANLQRPLPVAELARVAGMTPTWFKARFRAVYGQPPAQFVMRRRIDAALERLRAGQAVTRVAFDLGFASSQHFAAAVKRWTGKTPSAWAP